MILDDAPKPVMLELPKWERVILRVEKIETADGKSYVTYTVESRCTVCVPTTHGESIESVKHKADVIFREVNAMLYGRRLHAESPAPSAAVRPLLRRIDAVLLKFIDFMREPLP
jgi:hypothetical protein